MATSQDADWNWSTSLYVVHNDIETRCCSGVVPMHLGGIDLEADAHIIAPTRFCSLCKTEIAILIAGVVEVTGHIDDGDAAVAAQIGGQDVDGGAVIAGDIETAGDGAPKIVSRIGAADCAIGIEDKITARCPTQYRAEAGIDSASQGNGFCLGSHDYQNQQGRGVLLKMFALYESHYSFNVVLAMRPLPSRCCSM